MKYIMFESTEGQKLPVLFSDKFTHIFMAAAVGAIAKQTMNTDIKAVSAGFVGIGLDVSVSGESESLGGMKSVEADAARIMIGDSVAFYPDEMLMPLIEKLKERQV